MANVSYKISGKADNTAINQTQNAIGNLSKGFNTLKAGIAGFVALKAFGAITKGINDTVNSFKIQQDAIAKLTTSINNNSKLTDGSLKRIIDYSGQLQKKSIFGDEEIQKQATYLANLNLTEQQIQSVLQASVDMASSGMMPLDTAIKSMSKTFGGMAGELGEKIPALRELTAEQLKAGEGIALVQKQFAGALETAASTLEGKTKQAVNVVGDIKEKIGAIFGVGKAGFLDSIQPVLEYIDKWLEQNLSRIIQFFLNLPQIASLVFKSLGDMLKIVFTLSFWSNYWSAVWDLGWASFKSLGIAFVEYFKLIGVALWKPFEYGFYRLAKDIELMWNKMINVLDKPLNDMVNGFINAANLVPGVNLKNVPLRGEKSEDIKVKSYDEYVGKAVWDQFVVANSTMTREMGNVLNAYTDSVVKAVSPLSGTFENLISDIDVILSQDLPDNIVALLTPIKEAAEEAGLTAGGRASYGGTRDARSEYGSVASVDYGPSPMQAGMSQAMETVSGLFDTLGGSLGMIVQAISTSGPFGLVILALTKIFEGMMSVLGPLTDQVLKPVFDALNTIGVVIGQMLAPVLEALAPVFVIISNVLLSILLPLLQMLELPLSMVVALFTILTPVMKATAIAFEILTAPIKFLGDLFSWAAETIKIAVHNLKEYIDHPFRASKRNIWKYESFSSDAYSGLGDRIADIWNETGSSATATTSTSSAGGASASYSGSRDITVNVSIDRSAIADLRDVAILIRDEIKSAEALGW